VFDDLSIPVTIIASEDDPIVPIHDVYGLKENSYLHLSLQTYGGHCGFINFCPFECWYERKIEKIFSRLEKTG
jgi:hypothetical protein